MKTLITSVNPEYIDYIKNELDKNNFYYKMVEEYGNYSLQVNDKDYNEIKKTIDLEKTGEEMDNNQEENNNNIKVHYEEKDQYYIDSLLNKGIIFSILWAAGIGSLIAFRNGLVSLNIIKKSGYTLNGKGKAYWCIIAGTLGLLFWIPLYLIMFAQ